MNPFEKPVEEMSMQEINAMLAHTEDAILDLTEELAFLRKRGFALVAEIDRRKGV